MRIRLRSAPSKDELDRLYPAPHQHRRWPDHILRVAATVEMARKLPFPQNGTLADLSCGDATIAYQMRASHGAKLILGDYAPGYEYTGPIEETIANVEPGQVHLWVCSETLEHLEDPDHVLAEIRERTDHLIVSTPAGEIDSHNPEHIWGWDCEEMRSMLATAGFEPVLHEVMDHPAGSIYRFQLWGCA
jgi:hypothetical protein